MKIEQFNQLQIAYWRRVGAYGPENNQLMATFKKYLQEHNLLTKEAVILGIALDDPQKVPANQLRYDVGLVTEVKVSNDLLYRQVADGPYAILEVAHTPAAIQNFWGATLIGVRSKN